MMSLPMAHPTGLQMTEHRNHTSALAQLTKFCGLGHLGNGQLIDDEGSVPFDPLSFEIFTHIPLSGGTAWSWHLKATLKHSEIVPGSAVAASFRLPSSCPKVPKQMLVQISSRDLSHTIAPSSL